MKRVKNVRKARFRAALALTGHSQASWCAQEKVLPSELSHVLEGKRANPALVARIDAFTAKHLTAEAVGAA